MRYWDAVNGLWQPFTVTLVDGLIAADSATFELLSVSITSKSLSAFDLTSKEI
jgi:hypothetical protein